MSELFQSIVASIEEFDFGNYGFDDVEFTKDNPETRAWLYDLAHKIDKDYGDYVDGVTRD